jgi:hypothetical protein
MLTTAQKRTIADMQATHVDRTVMFLAESENGREVVYWEPSAYKMVKSIIHPDGSYFDESCTDAGE